MNWDRVEGNWKEFKGKAQQQWGKLTNDDLDVIEGRRNELAGRLQQRYGYAKDQAEKEIDSWLKSSHSPTMEDACAAWRLCEGSRAARAMRFNFTSAQPATRTMRPPDVPPIQIRT
jgi:uncharacterized protein YjbJ (UPF0337 family)